MNTPLWQIEDPKAGKNLRKLRKKLDLTQKGLAKSSGVSQSLIAKFESGKIDISLGKAAHIAGVLDQVGKKEQMTAKDLMTPKITGIGKTDRVSKASDIMKKNGYSQLPIISRGVCIGSISERAILNAIMEGRNRKALADMYVWEIKEDEFPTVLEKASLQELSSSLKNNDAVLVAKEGKLVGIVTRADLLKMVKG